MVKHIIFDLGNVIVNVHPQRAMESFVTQSRIPKSKIQEFYLSKLHLDFMRGKYLPDEFYGKMLAQYRFDLNMNDFFSTWNQVIGELKDGITQLIEQLSPKFTLSICSNTDQVHWSYCLENFPTLQKFQHYFLSFQIRHNKPDPHIFKELLSCLNAKGEECVFVDDTHTNIEGARRFHIRGIHADGTEQIKAELLKLGLL